MNICVAFLLLISGYPVNFRAISPRCRVKGNDESCSARFPRYITITGVGVDGEMAGEMQLNVGYVINSRGIDGSSRFEAELQRSNTCPWGKFESCEQRGSSDHPTWPPESHHFRLLLGGKMPWYIKSTQPRSKPTMTRDQALDPSRESSHVSTTSSR